MSVIVTCSCGANVRVAPERVGQLLRCPQCRTEFMATADARVVKFTGASTAVGATCPICQAAVQADEITLDCPGCRQVHHRECWAEIGGCSTYGCPQAPAISKETDAPQAPRSAWGDTKTCPVCGEKIKAIALRCRYCRTDFDTVDPLTVKDLGRRAQKQENLQSLRSSVTGLFICSLIGCLAPLVLLIALVWFLPKRQAVARAGPLYTVLGYCAILVTAIYNLLIVCFLLFGER